MANRAPVAGSSVKQNSELTVREEYKGEERFNDVTRRSELNTPNNVKIDDTLRPVQYVASICALEATLRETDHEVQSSFTTLPLTPHANHCTGSVVKDIEYKANPKAPREVAGAESTSYEAPTIPPHPLRVAQPSIMANFPGFEKRYELQQKVGSGGYGAVFACKNKATGQAFVVKIPLRRQHWWFPKDVNAALNEKAVLSVLKHDNIIAIRDIFEYKDKTDLVVPILVFGFATGGDLQHYVRYRAYNANRDARPIFQQLLRGLGYIHQQGFVHGDLKPTNILVFGRMGVCNEKDRIPLIKISDFGCTQKMDKYGYVRYPPASRYFCPPELYRTGAIMRSCPGVPSELWSLGCTLYFLLTKGRVCFVSLPVHTVYADATTRFALNLKNGWYRWPANSDTLFIRDDAKLLVHALLDMDPADRLSLAECETHYWVTSRGEEPVGRAPDRVASTRGFAQRWWVPDTEARFLRVTNPDPVVGEASGSEPASLTARIQSSPVTTAVRDPVEARQCAKSERQGSEPVMNGLRKPVTRAYLGMAIETAQHTEVTEWLSNERAGFARRREAILRGNARRRRWLYGSN